MSDDERIRDTTKTFEEVADLVERHEAIGGLRLRWMSDNLTLTEGERGRVVGILEARERARSFRQYRRVQIAELRPFRPGEDLIGVSVADVERAAGSPKLGDMIARNPKNHLDQWLVSGAYFAENFAPIDPPRKPGAGPGEPG